MSVDWWMNMETLSSCTHFINELKADILWISISSRYYFNDPIKSQFFTCHDIWAVMACVKLLTDLTIFVTEKNFFFKIWIMSSKTTFIKQVPSLCSFNHNVCFQVYKTSFCFSEYIWGESTLKNAVIKSLKRQTAQDTWFPASGPLII